MSDRLGRLGMNPVLEREIKQRMRSPRTTLIVVAYLALLAAILYGAYRVDLSALQTGGEAGSPGGLAGAALGRGMFETLLFFLLALVAFITPGVAAGGIAGERERRTLQLLQVTLLKPRSVVLGKVGASIAFLMLLIVASAPLFGVTLVLGGVGPAQVLRGFVVVIFFTFFLACLGTYISSVARRVQGATVACYAVTFLLLVGTLFSHAAEQAVLPYPDQSYPVTAFSSYLNTFAAAADAVGVADSPRFVPSPFNFFPEMVSQTRVEEPIADESIVRAKLILEELAVVSTREGVAHKWPLTAIETSKGLCLYLGESGRDGNGGCGFGSSPIGYVEAAVPWGDGRFFIGTVTNQASRVRVEFEDEDPVDVVPVGSHALSKRTGMAFWMASLPEGARESAVAALDSEGKELGRQATGTGSSFGPLPRALIGDGGSSGSAGRSWSLPSLWVVHVGLLLVVSVLLLFLASLRLRAPTPKFIIGRPDEKI